MKNKSFLFLIAALALGLALAGCSSDSDDGGGGIVKVAYEGDVEAIAAAFDNVDEVHLTKNITVGAQPLVIPTRGKLYVDGYAITMEANSFFVVPGAGNIDWGNSTKLAAAAPGAGRIVLPDTGTVYLVGPETVFEDNFADDSLAESVVEYIEPAAKAADITYKKVGDQAVGAVTSANLIFTNGTWTSNPGGTMLIHIGNLTVPAGGYTNTGGSLTVAGDVTLAGTLAGNGDLEVQGNLTSNVTAVGGVTVAGIDLVGGSVSARSITTKGGKFPSYAAITSTAKRSVFGGTLTTFTDTLEAAGPVRFDHNVTFTKAATLNSDAEFNGIVTSAEQSTVGSNAVFGKSSNLDGYLTANSVALSGTLTIASGSLATDSALTLNSANSIVLGEAGGIEFTATGKLTGDAFNISGAGSLLNPTANGGTTVTFDNSGITKGAGSGTVSIVFADAAHLIFNKSQSISGIELKLASEAGSISIGTKSATLTLTGGGSITAANTQGTLGSGKLYIVTSPAGSLVAGTMDAGGSIAAGSYGTIAADKNFIYHAGVAFILAGTQTAFGLNQINGDVGGSASVGGSVAVFSDAE
jgi:hypothetical protein